MGHGPAVKLGKDNAAGYKTKLGIGMFIVYTLVYFGFVVINATKPSLMQEIVFGQTLAVVYGLGLLFFALVLAVIYNQLCTNAEARLNK
ncbi:hypothetical protein DESUT3_30700 [Desulfuromonas versatilis]|uniref:DUF485 domain-containing protein n=1 Tax=Desulfuromonas versatilis TaxID=2802975 RepID=A0ABM8HVL0_9BACT|nr:DUF485 domain-containing protein [Desulfuromonas versatilis]BCR06001.1 hypothetical protein DESUT3_30700 [Desulfuromonas versatilis]